MARKQNQQTKGPMSLTILSYFKSFFIKIGVDYNVLYKILTIKLLMDGRKTSTVFNREQKEQEGKGFRKELFFNLFIGAFLALLLIMPGFPILYMMSGIFGTVILYLSLYMLADFSSVMLDIRDLTIIGTKPVNGKTINIAKMVHTIIYLTTTVLSLVALPLIVSLFRFGPLFFIVFLVEIILMTLFVMFLTSIIYYILVSLLDGEKLKDMINYIQMIFSILVVVGQQVIPRAFTVMGNSITYSFHEWFYLLPPMWMSAPLEMVENGVTHGGYITMTILSIVMPSILFILYIKYMAPYFEAKLIKLNNGGVIKTKGTDKKMILPRRIGNVICKEPIEKASYNFVMHMTKTERKFKLQLYPSLALYTILPWIMIIAFVDHYDNSQSVLQQIRQGKAYFWLYMALSIGSYCLTLVNRSENYGAAWIYKISPSPSPVPILKGTIKAIIVKYNLPFTIVQCVLFIALYGVQIIPQLIVIVLNSILFLLISFKLLKKQMPFSIDFSIKETSKGSLSIGMMSLLLVIALVHFGLSYMPYANMVIGIISTIAIIMMWRNAFKIEWGEIENGQSLT